MRVLNPKISLALLLATTLLLGAPAHSQPISLAEPEQMLQQATDQLLEITREAQRYAYKDRERYYSEMSGVLDQIVDIRFFARSVMATYASARLYNSLKTDAERAALRDRLARFEITLKRVWMVKYADALLGLKAKSIELAKLSSVSDSKSRTTIQQTVLSEDGESYVLQYSLRKSKENTWLICNVIVEDVNLGLIYRNQFASAVEKHKGDVDYVVDHWAEIMIDEPAPVSSTDPAEPG